jgi:hypothetical protein
MMTGGCLCGAIRYEIRGPLGRNVFCHCSRCRKASGSVVAFNAPLSAKYFAIVSGESSLKAFKTESGVSRMFCSNCGSQIISKRESAPDVVRLRLGTLDTPPAHGPEAHIFAASKIDWLETNDAPHFDAAPPPEFVRPPSE